MMRKPICTIILVSILAPAALAQRLDDLPRYKPRQEVYETIRSWGSDDMAGLMKAWEQGFVKYHSGIHFADTLKGTDTAQAALYTEVTDLALMDREILPLEWYGLFRRKHYFPLMITVAHGSADVPNKAFAPVIFVHKDNPISKLTLNQLDGIFGEVRNGGWDDHIIWHAEKARGANENIRTWGQLGLTGEWADKPIHVYGFPVTVWTPSVFAPGAAYFFRVRVFNGGDKWNSDLMEYEKGDQIADALSRDPYGIGYTCLGYRRESIKPVALASRDGGNYVEPTRENIAGGKYPLTRPVYISIDRAPGGPLNPKVAEFLRFILSREGQEVVARDSGYLPLNAEEIRAELKKLE